MMLCQTASVTLVLLSEVRDGSMAEEMGRSWGGFSFSTDI